MPFPVSLKGTLRLPVDATTGANAQQLAGRIEDMLRAAAATRVTRCGTSVSFTAGVFRPVFNWNILMPFGSGIISVKSAGNVIEIRYDLSTLQMLIIATAMVVGGDIFVYKNDIQLGEPTSIGFIVLFALMWLWLFVGNYVLALIRFPRWLRRGLRDRLPTPRPAV